MRRWLTIAICIAAIFVAVAVTLWVYSTISFQKVYNRQVLMICSTLTNINNGFATYVSSADDFSALKKECEDIQKKIGEQIVELEDLGLKGVPEKFALFHNNLRSLLGAYSVFYGQVAVEAANWNKSSFELVETKRTAIQGCQDNCSNTWPKDISPISNNPSWCIGLVSDLKKLADSKKTSHIPTITASSGYVVVLPSIGEQLTYNPAAGYISAMRQLLSGYKRLRGDLDRAIQIYDSGGGISFNILNNAIQSRCNILNIIQDLNPPPEYSSAHTLAINTINTSIAAVEALRDRGDRQTLHEVSQINNANMAQLRSIYSF